MLAGGKNAAVIIGFPDLSPAEASILAKELAQDLTLAAAGADQITLERADDGAQDLGSILVIAAGSGLGAGFIELAKDAGKGVVVGAANRVGQKTLDAIWPVLRKWRTRAKIEAPSGEAIIVGEEYSRAAAPRTAAAELKTLGLVILGASTFSHYPQLNNPAFKRSAELAEKVLSPAHTVFGEVEVLNLFNADLRPDEIVDRIEDLVERRPDIHDAVFYYCGHGDFFGREHTYYLVLKETRPGREVATGLAIKQFLSMIEPKGVLASRRCTFILDCCFAGEAVSAFFSSTGLRSIACLTASDKDLWAQVKGDYTMFTGALAEVLTAQAGMKRLSLGELCAAMAECIRERHKKVAVIPQCHAPRQVDGDISRIPMFVAGSATPGQPKIKALEPSVRVPLNSPPSQTRVLQDGVPETRPSRLLSQKKQEFWTQLKAYARQKERDIGSGEPQESSYRLFGIGKRGARICFTIYGTQGSFTVQLYIDDNKALYAELFGKKDAIEQDLGEIPDWQGLPGRKASRIEFTFHGDFRDESKWESYFERLLDLSDKIRRVFPKYWPS